jgi:hypothetical protein
MVSPVRKMQVKHSSKDQHMALILIHFTSALQRYKSWLPAVMIGDFNASFGQGLIMHSGFGAGKSSFVTSIKKTGYTLRPMLL